MKTLIALVACLFTQLAFAGIVIHSTGVGETQDEAVRRAKITAVEGITGSFNLGHRSVRDDKYKEEIDDYVSGIILETSVLESKKVDGMWHVKIRAVVENTKQGTFEIVQDKPLFDERVKNKIAEMNSRKDVINKFDSADKMLFFKENQVLVEPLHETTRVSIRGTVQWQEKWVTDFEKFVLYAGNMNTAKKTYNTNLYSPVSYSHPVFAVGHILTNPSESETRPGHSFCFATKNQRIDAQRCANLGYDMTKMPKFDTLNAYIVFKDAEGRIIEKTRFTKHDVKLLEYASAGTTKKDQFLFFHTSHYFKTNTSIIITDASVPLSFDFLVRNDLAAKVSSYSVVIN
jgi:hypothetical protein